MPEDERPGPSQVEIHEEFIQHVEDGSSKMRLLSAVSAVVAAILILSYISQLVLPLAGTTTVTVNLVDPTLIATEAGVLVLALAWLYVGVRDYRFTTRLARQIAEARASESQIEKEIAG
jgi:hypothetical protein